MDIARQLHIYYCLKITKTPASSNTDDIQQIGENTITEIVPAIDHSDDCFLKREENVNLEDGSDGNDYVTDQEQQQLAVINCC